MELEGLRARMSKCLDRRAAAGVGRALIQELIDLYTATFGSAKAQRYFGPVECRGFALAVVPARRERGKPGFGSGVLLGLMLGGFGGSGMAFLGSGELVAVMPPDIVGERVMKLAPALTRDAETGRGERSASAQPEECAGAQADQESHDAADMGSEKGEKACSG